MGAGGLFSMQKGAWITVFRWQRVQGSVETTNAREIYNENRSGKRVEDDVDARGAQMVSIRKDESSRGRGEYLSWHDQPYQSQRYERF